VANTADQVVEAWQTARTEALAGFGSAEVYMEKYLGNPRHIEVQILADMHGTVVHLGERDCSLQRKHQKVLEEAPSPALDAAARERIGAVACKAARTLGYHNAGTMEFLYEDGQFYFMEMNTRLQVEHPVSEMITTLDLVKEQIRVAQGEHLGYTQDDIRFHGHAIECRINAENPVTFAPSPGTIGRYHAPGGMGVRVESGLYTGLKVPPHYDSMIAKLIVHGANRTECLMRLRRALGEYVIEGVETTIPLHQRLMQAPAFVTGDYDIRWLERFVTEGA